MTVLELTLHGVIPEPGPLVIDVTLGKVGVPVPEKGRKMGSSRQVWSVGTIGMQCLLLGVEASLTITIHALEPTFTAIAADTPLNPNDKWTLKGQALGTNPCITTVQLNVSNEHAWQAAYCLVEEVNGVF